MTMGEIYGPAMEMTEQGEADAYFETLVEMTMRLGAKTRAEAEAIERSNLGYYAGYYDNETRARVERLFRCEHPVFGPIALVGPPTVEEAFRLGMEMGRGQWRGPMRTPEGEC
jgi:hypothetical protein